MSTLTKKDWQVILLKGQLPFTLVKQDRQLVVRKTIAISHYH